MSRLPEIWSKFTATNKAGNSLNLRIVNMPEYFAENVLKQYMNYFVKEESTFKAAGIAKSVEAMEELRTLTSKSAKDKEINIVVCSLDNNDDKIDVIVGASLMVFETKEDSKPEFHPKSEEMQKLFEIFNGMASHYDETKELNLDRSFLDRGLFVHPDYRGYGIAQELLKVRRLICKEHGISTHGAWMTSYGTQKAAERDGWESVCDISYDSLAKAHGVVFENGPPSCKFMITRIS